MSRVKPSIPEVVRQAGKQPEAILRETARLIGAPPLKVDVKNGALVGSTRTFTLQVFNLNNQPCRGYYRLDVFAALTPGGAPALVDEETFTTGVVLGTPAVHKRWQLMTSADGTVVMTMTYTGTRVVHAAVEVAFESGEAASN